LDLRIPKGLAREIVELRILKDLGQWRVVSGEWRAPSAKIGRGQSFS